MDNHPYPAGYGLAPEQRKPYNTFKTGLTNLIFNQRLQSFHIDLTNLYHTSNIAKKHAAEIMLDELDRLEQYKDPATEEMSDIILDLAISLT
jgi:hypothetical protein